MEEMASTKSKPPSTSEPVEKPAVKRRVRPKKDNTLAKKKLINRNKKVATPKKTKAVAKKKLINRNKKVATPKKTKAVAKKKLINRNKKVATSKKTKAVAGNKEEIEDLAAGDSDQSSEAPEKLEPQESNKSGKKKEGAVEEAPNNVKEHAISEDEDSEDELPASKSHPGKRALAAKQSASEPASKKSKPSNAEGGDKTKLNQTFSNYGDINFDSAAQTKDGKKWNFKISSWNVAGLKAWVKKRGVDFIKHENPDIICLQETKCSEANLPREAKVAGYHKYWLTGEKTGYAGVALLSKEKPLKVDFGIGDKDFDTDGRLITAEYEKFFLVAVYVPNAGQKLKNLDRRMEWDPLFRAHLKKLDEKKPVILCGDMNVSHEDIDLANPKTNNKSAGFTREERDGFSELLKEGFVDTFRNLYPEKTGAYTFWTYMGNARSRNTGWRLDYFVLSERFVPRVCDNVIRNDVYGSDHCPITLFLHI